MPTYPNRGGDALNHTDQGSGRAVLLVHGVGSNLQAWDGVLHHLPATRRYLRCDLRGHGRSARVPGPYTLAGMAQDIVDLADHLGIERFALVGFSLGGLIAQQVALTSPGRLDALALVSTVAGRTEDERRRVLDRRDMLAREGPVTNLANAVDRWFTPEFAAANPDLIEARRAAAMENDPACYMAAYNVLAENDLGDSLSRIAVPTLVMTGEHDIGSNARMARLMHARIAGSRLQILPRLKHSILIEAPALVAAHLDALLVRTDPDPH